MILMILYSGSGAHATLRTKFFGEPERLRAIFAICLLAAKGTECTLRNRAHIGAHRCQIEHRPSIAVSGPDPARPESADSLSVGTPDEGS
jgi:hypothetical protein